MVVVKPGDASNNMLKETSETEQPIREESEGVDSKSQNLPVDQHDQTSTIDTAVESQQPAMSNVLTVEYASEDPFSNIPVSQETAVVTQIPQNQEIHQDVEHQDIQQQEMQTELQHRNNTQAQVIEQEYYQHEQVFKLKFHG